MKPGDIVRFVVEYNTRYASFYAGESVRLESVVNGKAVIKRGYRIFTNIPASFLKGGK
jgi:hypothetical protein